MSDISRDELDFLSDIRPMAGPATHICWTPDGVPPEKRVVMVLVPADEFHAMKMAIRNCRAAIDAAEVKLNETLLSLGSRNKEIRMLKATLNNRNMDIKQLKERLK